MRAKTFILFAAFFVLTQACAEESSRGGANLMSDIDCCHFQVGTKQITIEDLLEACASTGKTANSSPPYFDCQSYILGVVETFRAPTQIVEVEKQLCIPRNYETRNLLEVVWGDYEKIWDEYQRTKREEEYDRVVAHRSASDFIYASLIKRFGCKSPPKPNKKKSRR